MGKKASKRKTSRKRSTRSTPNSSTEEISSHSGDAWPFQKLPDDVELINDYNILGENVQLTAAEIRQSKNDERVEELALNAIATLNDFAASANDSDLELEWLHELAQIAIGRLNDLPLERRRRIARLKDTWPAILSKVHVLNVNLIETLPSDLELGKQSHSLFDVSTTLKNSSDAKSLSALLIAAISNLRHLNRHLQELAKLYALNLTQLDTVAAHQTLALERNEYCTVDIDTYASLSELAEFLAVVWPSHELPTPEFGYMCELCLASSRLPQVDNRAARLAWFDFAFVMIGHLTSQDFSLPKLVAIGAARAQTRGHGRDPKYFKSDIRDGLRDVFLKMLSRADSRLL